MKSLLVCLGLFLSVNLFHEKTQACNAYHGGGFGFGDMGGHHPHMHMNVHGHQGYNGGYGGQYGYNGFGNLMDSFFRSDIGSGSHYPHGRSSLIPISRHRHIHRVHRRSARHHVTYNQNQYLRPSVGFYMGGSSGPYSLVTICLSTWIITEVAVFLLFMGGIMTAIKLFLINHI